MSKTRHQVTKHHLFETQKGSRALARRKRIKTCPSDSKLWRSDEAAAFLVFCFNSKGPFSQVDPVIIVSRELTPSSHPSKASQIDIYGKYKTPSVLTYERWFVPPWIETWNLPTFMWAVIFLLQMKWIIPPHGSQFQIHRVAPPLNPLYFVA